MASLAWMHHTWYMAAAAESGASRKSHSARMLNASFCRSSAGSTSRNLGTSSIAGRESQSNCMRANESASCRSRAVIIWAIRLARNGEMKSRPSTYGYESSWGLAFAVQMNPVSGLYDHGSASNGTSPVHSNSSVHPGTGSVPSPRRRIG